MRLSDAASHVTEADRSFEERVHDLESISEVPSEAREIVCHDAGRAALNFARTRDVQLMLGTLKPGRWHPETLGTDTDWFVRKMPCEVAFYAPRTNGRMESLHEIVVPLPPLRPAGGVRGRFTRSRVRRGPSVPHGNGRGRVGR